MDEIESKNDCEEKREMTTDELEELYLWYLARCTTCGRLMSMIPLKDSKYKTGIFTRDGREFLCPNQKHISKEEKEN